MPMPEPPLRATIEEARKLAGLGAVNQAAALYRKALAISPDLPEALDFLGRGLMAAGRYHDGLALLEKAAASDPRNPLSWLAYGAAQQATGNPQGALASLQTSFDLAPQNAEGQLRLASCQQQLGLKVDAFRNYYRAIAHAQSKGEWISKATTPPMIYPLLAHAMNFISEFRTSLFAEILAPLRLEYPPSELARVESFFSDYLNGLQAAYTNNWQRPKMHFFPGIPAQPYFPVEQLPWICELESGAPLIRQELEHLLGSTQVFEPFLSLSERANPDDYLRSTRGNAAWDAYFFYRHGHKNIDNTMRCKQTAALIESLPIARIPEHAPEILFSVLAPGTRIMPHHGATNMRIVVHLPLIVPEGCALTVGGEEHIWKEGRCVAFDDSFEHEAVNRSTSTRVVMILDAWNPHLTEPERAALAKIIPALTGYHSLLADAV